MPSSANPSIEIIQVLVQGEEFFEDLGLLYPPKVTNGLASIRALRVVVGHLQKFPGLLALFGFRSLEVR